MAEYWETFRAGPTRSIRDRVHVTISDKGVILLNRNAHKMLGSPEAAVLLFNKADGKIGINPAHAQLAEAFPVREKHGYWIINAAPFCRYFGINVVRTEAFVRPEVDPQGILRLDLATTVSVAGRKRK